MTDRIRDAIAAVIRGHRNAGRSSEEIADAVLAMLGPKPLVWVYPSDGSTHDMDCRYEATLDGKFWRLVKGVTGGGAYISHYKDRATAQAAAQSHANAAYWAESKIGGA